MPSRRTISAAKMLLPLYTAIIAAFLSTSCTKEGDDKAGMPPAGGSEPASAMPPAVKEIQGDPASGKVVYEKHCHYCHGMKGRGDGPVGFALTPHPLNFVDDKRRMAQSDAALFKSITEGVRKEIGGESMFMPRWKEILSEKERWDVLAYIRKLSKEGGSTPSGRKKNK